MLHLGRFRLGGARNKENTGEESRCIIFSFSFLFIVLENWPGMSLLYVGGGDCYGPVKSSWRSPLCRGRWSGHLWWIWPARWSECASLVFAPTKSERTDIFHHFWQNRRRILEFCHFLDMAVTVSKWKEYSTWHQSRYIWHVCHQKFCRAARIAIYFSLLLTVFNLPIFKDLVRVFFCIAVKDWGIILLVYCHFWLYLLTSVFAFLLVFTNTVCIPACICSPVGNWQAYRQDSWLDSEGKRSPLVAPWCLTTCSQTQESARNSWNIQMFLNHTFRHSWTCLPEKCLYIELLSKDFGLCSTF